MAEQRRNSDGRFLPRRNWMIELNLYEVDHDLAGGVPVVELTAAGCGDDIPTMFLDMAQAMNERKGAESQLESWLVPARAAADAAQEEPGS
jgi:hypothetical protein